MKQSSRLLFLVLTVFGIGATLFFINKMINADKKSTIVVDEKISEEDTVTREGDASAEIVPVIDGIQASAVGVYTVDGDEIYSFRPDKRWPIASIAKLMTSLVSYELFDIDETVTITEDMVSTEGVSGNLKAGDEITVGDLIEAMLLVSSNDAAEALAQHYGRLEFVSRMNSFAEDIGMINTNFVDPSGLSIQNLSTTEDLRKLAVYILNNEPHIFEITTRKTGIILDIKTGSRGQLENINLFAGRDGFLGGKTGQIPEAGGNLLSVFNLPERDSQVVIIVFGAEDRFLETEKILGKL